MSVLVGLPLIKLVGCKREEGKIVNHVEGYLNDRVWRLAKKVECCRIGLKLRRKEPNTCSFLHRTSGRWNGEIGERDAMISNEHEKANTKSGHSTASDEWPSCCDIVVVVSIDLDMLYSFHRSSSPASSHNR